MPSTARPLQTYTQNLAAEPFIKWVGGKRQLLPQILGVFPPQYGRYYEPFLGGGAVYYTTGHPAVLGDINERLVRCNCAVRDQAEAVISLLDSYPDNAQTYASLRQCDIDRGTDVEVAAWLIYLNKTSFNGLYRVNSCNQFNVPRDASREGRRTICDADALRRCSLALRRADLRCGDFEATVQDAQPGDLVYFDPPYVPVSATSSFTGYARGGFTMRDQVRLRDVALGLKARGVSVILSNSGTDDVQRLYSQDFALMPVQATRRVNSRASARGPVKEWLIYAHSPVSPTTSSWLPPVGRRTGS